MRKTNWRVYGDLAWTEHILAPPEDYKEEADLFSKIIREHSKIEVRTLLHLGCGAGGHDHTFKKHFKVTGIDISENMLELARELNPDVAYFIGDMRIAKLDERFDAVAIPDSIGHMTTEEELRKAVRTADEHLKPGGVLLIVTPVKEEFRENNFVYTGAKGDVKITLFENNSIPDPEGTTYKATVVFLIWRKGKLEIHSDTDVLGLFELDAWHTLLKDFSFDIKQIKLSHSYDQYLVGEGEYPLQIFVCSKPL
jgi:SAM-dependent methyltransferase